MSHDDDIRDETDENDRLDRERMDLDAEERIEGDDDALQDERTVPSVNTRRSSGKSFLKSVALMVLGVGALVLLLLAVLPSHAPPKKTSVGDNQVENRLPPYSSGNENGRPPAPAAAKTTTAPAVPVAAQSQRPQGMTPAEQLMARRQRAPIIAFGGSGQGSSGRGGASDDGSGMASGMAGATLVAANYGPGLAEPGKHPQGRDTLGSQLTPTSTPMAYASVLPDRNFMITKGTFIDCALETAIDSSVAGFTSCRVTTNVYSDNGRVLLLERGSRITGQYQSGQMKPGLSRIFVLWDRVETPNGVVVDLNSPGIDALGRAGLPGYVNHHFLQRFGAALMLSLVDDFAKYEVAKQQNSQQVQFTDSSSQTQQLAAIALQDSIGIQPTLFKNQGDHIKIYVARDINFGKIYALQERN